MKFYKAIHEEVSIKFVINDMRNIGQVTSFRIALFNFF